MENKIDEKNEDQPNALLAILGEQIDKVVSENKDFYENPIQNNNQTPKKNDKMHASKYEASPEPENIIQSLEKLQENEKPKNEIKRTNFNKGHKSKVVQFSEEPTRPKQVETKTENSSKKIELPDVKKEEKRNIDFDPINANIKDSFDEKDENINLEIEQNNKKAENNDDDFDYDFSALPAKIQASEEKKEVEKTDINKDMKVIIKNEEEQENVEKIENQENYEETEKLQNLLKENLNKKPKEMDPQKSDVILEEKEEISDSEISQENLKPAENIENALPIAKIIESELKNTKNTQNDDLKIQKENEQKIREMKEEIQKVKLKNEKLKETATGGLFMNNLATKAKNPINLQDSTKKPDLIPQAPEISKEEKKENLIKNDETPSKVPFTDEWDKINEQRKIELEAEKCRSKNEIEADILTYEMAWENLKKQDLSKELTQIVREDMRYLNVFQKIFSGCLTRFKLDKNLHEERDIILGLMKQKMKTEFHSVMVNRILQLISQYAPEGEIKNMILIGFQNINPETDIRDTGMFGVLQVLYYAEKYPDLIEKAFLLSIDEKQKFPLVIIMFGFTALAAEALREGRLTGMSNKTGSVIKIMNYFYSATFTKFIERWDTEKLTIVDNHRVFQEIKNSCKERAREIVEEFLTKTKLGKSN